MDLGFQSPMNELREDYRVVALKDRCCDECARKPDKGVVSGVFYRL